MPATASCTSHRNGWARAALVLTALLGCRDKRQRAVAKAVPAEVLDAGAGDASTADADAAEANVVVADAADDFTLHFRPASGPAATVADACTPLVASCGRPDCRCDPALAVIAPTSKKHPFLEARTLAVGGTIHPAFRSGAGWFVGASEDLDYHTALPDMGNKTTWRTVRVVGVEAEDVLPGGDLEIVFHFAWQHDIAYGGAMGGSPVPRTPATVGEVVVVCTTAGKSPSCFLVTDWAATGTKKPSLRFPTVSSSFELTLPKGVSAIDGPEFASSHEGPHRLALP